MSSAVVLSKPFIRPARQSDILDIAAHMRAEDTAEIWHSSRVTPWSALYRGMRDSDATFVIERNGVPVAMFGVVGEKGRWGSPWMLGTDELKNCKSLLRECRVRLDEYLKEYHYLANAVWAENTVHIEWIKWLGFQFEGEELRNGETFLQFHRSLNV